MPLTQELTDDFNDNIVDPVKWPNNFNTGAGGLPTESGGRARVPCESGTAAYASDTIYTLQDSYAFVQSFPPTGGGDMVEAQSQLVVTSSTPGDQVVFEIDTATNLLAMTLQVGGVDESGSTIPYNATDHAWLRVREDAGTVYWDTAADGRQWTTRHTEASPAWVSDVDLQILLQAHCSPEVTGSPTGRFAQFDNFNVAPVLPDGYTVEIDWSGDGDFNDVAENVTDDILADGPVNFQYGRDQARALSPPRVGALDFGLCNPDGIYSPGNPDSPIGDEIAPAAPIRVQEVIDDVLYPLMTGRIDDFQVVVDRGNRSVDITGLDGLALLRGTKISTGVFQAKRTGTLVGVILDEIGWSAPRDIDLGATYVPWWWANEQDAFDLLVQLIASEGPPAIAYIAPDGTFIYRDRHHRLLRAESLTSQATFARALTEEECCEVTGFGEGGYGECEYGG